MNHVVLFSGGIDSTTVLAMVVKEHGPKQVYFLRGEFQSKQSYQEATVVNRIAVHRYELLGQSVPLHWIPSGNNRLIVPGRNLVLIGAAVSVAQSLGATNIYIGCNADDVTNFPDCSQEYLQAAKSAVKLGYGIDLHFPLARMTKKQVVARARELGVNLDETYSCYTGNQEHCGQCLACKMRADVLEARDG